MLMKYTVILEQGLNIFGASVPELPGWIAVAATREVTRQLIQEAMAFQIEGLKLQGKPIPQPLSTTEIVDVTVAA
jgi:predicted RNase H-like HicB family nuclease